MGHARRSGWRARDTEDASGDRLVHAADATGRTRELGERQLRQSPQLVGLLWS
jgi:hypothetical protein